MEAIQETEGQDPVDAVIARLYCSGLSVPAADFRQWALQQLCSLIACDGALWGSGTTTRWRFHTRTVVGLPDDFPAQLEATRDINPLVPKVIAKLERPADLDSEFNDDAFHRTDIYRRVFEPQGIHRILSAGHLERRSGLYSLVSLYRRDRAQPFTAAERACLQRLTYHLFNAASHAFFIQMLHRSDRPLESGAAVVDDTGLFHEADSRFLELIEAHYPEREQLHSLPFGLPKPTETLLIGSLAARAERMGDMFLIHLWEAGPLDRLTRREREIVHAVAQGLSFKQVARKIGVAPSTVANHLYRVYRKLGVYSRSELAGLVYPGS